jgi:CheY-like chemotaxis protein
MSVPIIICDDSSFARKQLARALSSGWDVDITFAGNGLEGVEAVRAGKGDIMFLDLTMPVLDGYGALEIIRQEDLPTMVIVVSGDVQKDAYARVMSLGAIDFIKKPVDIEKLTEVLDKYGILDELVDSTNTEDPEKHDSDKVDLTDWISEISNVAMGQTADLLAQLFKIFVHLSVPSVRLLSANELRMVLANMQDSESYHPVVGQGFIGGRISGENILHLNDISTNDLAELINSEMSGPNEVLELELVMDMANILIGAFLKSITSLLDLNFSHGHPTVLNAQDLEASRIEDKERVLTIELNYAFENYEFTCNQLIIFTEDSLETLNTYARYASG